VAAVGELWDEGRRGGKINTTQNTNTKETTKPRGIHENKKKKQKQEIKKHKPKIPITLKNENKPKKSQTRKKVSIKVQASTHGPCRAGW